MGFRVFEASNGFLTRTYRVWDGKVVYDTPEKRARKLARWDMNHDRLTLFREITETGEEE